ncbi:LCP family protein [Amycolatopsis cihanbeyliensis]|uniref:LCP family protein n=1 Tax=Amycolatopsis cihanbeyliensis TaxID=1128664 RepID=UPI00114E0E45|nr:LCP family protein [Amycolatopsis cihanbeyliensis]
MNDEDEQKAATEGTTTELDEDVTESDQSPEADSAADTADEEGEEPVAERPRPTPYPRSTPPRPRRGGRGRRAVGRTLLGLLSAVALAATGYAYSTVDDLRDNVNTTDALGQQDERRSPPADDGANDILLVGTDARTDMEGNPLPPAVLRTLRTEGKAGINTDTLILLRIPRNGGKPAAVSIPRDSWVAVPDGGNRKINAPYGIAKSAAAQRLRAAGETDRAKIERESDQAGRKALVQTVQDLTQIRVDHYAEVNLLGFYLMTEALGGVKVCLKHATVDKDSGASFRAGPQVVDGGEALAFVRQRKNLPRGDLDRIQRQQAFLASALHKVLSAGTLTDTDKLGRLTDALRRSLVLDRDLDLLSFAEQVRDVATGEMEFRTIPVVAVGARSQDGQSIIEVDLAEVRRFIGSLAGRDNPPASTPSPTSGTTPDTQEDSGGGGAPGGRQPTDPITVDGVPCVN